MTIPNIDKQKAYEEQKLKMIKELENDIKNHLLKISESKNKKHGLIEVFKAGRFSGMGGCLMNILGLGYVVFLIYLGVPYFHGRPVNPTEIMLIFGGILLSWVVILYVIIFYRGNNELGIQDQKYVELMKSLISRKKDKIENIQKVPFEDWEEYVIKDAKDKQPSTNNSYSSGDSDFDRSSNPWDQVDSLTYAHYAEDQKERAQENWDKWFPNDKDNE